MIPGNEPTGDGRYVGITTVTERSGVRSLHVIGRDDMAADEELGTMIGRFRRAEEVNEALRSWTEHAHADEVVDACVEARVPATIVGNGAELPRFEQLVARGVRARSRARRGSGPRAPFRFHGVADRELRRRLADERTDDPVAGAARPRAAARMRSATARSPACACSTSPRSGPVRPRPRGSPRWAPT